MSIGQQIAGLERMTVGQLQARYAEVFGEPARSGNRAFLSSQHHLYSPVANDGRGGKAIGRA